MVYKPYCMPWKWINIAYCFRKKYWLLKYHIIQTIKIHREDSYGIFRIWGEIGGLIRTVQYPILSNARLSQTLTVRIKWRVRQFKKSKSVCVCACVSVCHCKQNVSHAYDFHPSYHFMLSLYNWEYVEDKRTLCHIDVDWFPLLLSIIVLSIQFFLIEKQENTYSSMFGPYDCMYGMACLLTDDSVYIINYLNFRFSMCDNFKKFKLLLRAKLFSMYLDRDIVSW